MQTQSTEKFEKKYGRNLKYEKKYENNTARIQPDSEIRKNTEQVRKKYEQCAVEIWKTKKVQKSTSKV